MTSASLPKNPKQNYENPTAQASSDVIQISPFLTIKLLALLLSFVNLLLVMFNIGLLYYKISDDDSFRLTGHLFYTVFSPYLVEYFCAALLFFGIFGILFEVSWILIVYMLFKALLFFERITAVGILVCSHIRGELPIESNSIVISAIASHLAYIIIYCLTLFATFATFEDIVAERKKISASDGT